MALRVIYAVIFFFLLLPCLLIMFHFLFVRFLVFSSVSLFCVVQCLILIISPTFPVPFPHTLSAGRRPVWRRTQSWTGTSVTGWVWAVVTPSPTAATVAMWQLPNVSPSVSFTWTDSGGLTCRATSARSELPGFKFAQLVLTDSSLDFLRLISQLCLVFH